MVCKILLRLLGHWALTAILHGKNCYAYLVEEETEAQEDTTGLSSHSGGLWGSYLSTLDWLTPPTLPTAAKGTSFCSANASCGHFLSSSQKILSAFHPPLSCPTATCLVGLSLNIMSLSVHVSVRDPACVLL